MSKLVLTKFEISSGNVDLKNYEKPLVPAKGEQVFVYTTGLTAVDLANKSIIKKSMGWSKLDKLSNMTSAQVKAIQNNKGSEFVDDRTVSLHDMYEELSDYFCKLLHDATWNQYGTKNGKEKYVLSTINFDDCYEDIRKVIECLELLKRNIINDKYNEKYSENEVQNALKTKTLQIEQTIGKLKK